MLSQINNKIKIKPIKAKTKTEGVLKNLNVILNKKEIQKKRLTQQIYTCQNREIKEDIMENCLTKINNKKNTDNFYLEKDVLEDNSPKPITSEIDNDYSQLDVIKSQLEKDLGINLFNKAYQIVDDSVPQDSIRYNHEIISKKIIKDLMNNYENKNVLLSIEKIPELFSLLIKERETKKVFNLNE